MCQNGARVVQKEVLDKIESKDLQVYTVWEPILRGDDKKSAQAAPAFMQDSRVTHFWTSTRQVGHLFQETINLSEVAWDVYLVYPPGVTWNEKIPEPSYYQHQLGGRLPEDHRLNGPLLAKHLKDILNGRGTH